MSHSTGHVIKVIEMNVSWIVEKVCPSMLKYRCNCRSSDWLMFFFLFLGCSTLRYRDRHTSACKSRLNYSFFWLTNEPKSKQLWAAISMSVNMLCSVSLQLPMCFDYVPLWVFFGSKQNTWFIDNDNIWRDSCALKFYIIIIDSNFFNQLPFFKSLSSSLFWDCQVGVRCKPGHS